MRILLAGLILACSSPLAAQNPGGIPWEDEPARRMVDKRPTPGEWMLGADGGFASYLAPEFKERATRFAFFAERNVLPWLGVQADLTCGKGTFRQTIITPASFIGMCSSALSAVVPIPVTYGWWPYIRLGAGYAFWDEESAEGFWDVDTSAPAYIAAFGTRYFPLGNDKVGIRFDAQRMQTSLRDLDVAQWSYGFGVTLRIPRAR